MGLPVISYNSKTVSFPEDFDNRTMDYPDVAMMNKSASGLAETLGVRADVSVSVLNTMMSSDSLKQQLQQFFAWAKSGAGWTLARDSANVVNTTISSGAAAGAGSVVVTSATGITIGNRYVIRSKTRVEVVTCTNVSGTTISFTGSELNFAYASGARFRAEEFWPGRLVDVSPIVIEQPPVLYTFSMKFIEDVNSL